MEATSIAQTSSSPSGTSSSATTASDDHAQVPAIPSLNGGAPLTHFQSRRLLQMATSLAIANTTAVQLHGRISCRRYFTSDEQSQTIGKWRVVAR
jgi:hypothetical protein